MSAYPGIDYSGPGATCNRDLESGIRYGVISCNSLGDGFYDAQEMDYGTPHCPKCGNDAITIMQDVPAAYEDYETARHECTDYACESCKYLFGSESAYPDEAQGWHIDDGEYKVIDCLDNDAMVIASPYYTIVQFCSPCVPGAGNLDNACEDGARTYCFGHDWFEDNKAPYPVFLVFTGEPVPAPESEVQS